MKKPKAIVHIGRNVTRPRRFIGYVYRDAALVCCGGRLPGGVTGNAAHDYESLILGHHGAGRLLRSLVISLDCPSSDDFVRLHSAALGHCCEDFCNRYAPGSPYLFGVHHLGNKLHAHLLVRNSDSEKCFDWRPEVLQEMQNFGWTTEFDSGRGKGLNHVVGKTCYPATHTVAGTLAALGVEALKALLEAGDLAITRTKKDGSPLTLKFEDRKIRVQTVSAIDSEFSERLCEAMNSDGDGGPLQLLELIRRNRSAKRQNARSRGLHR